VRIAVGQLDCRLGDRAENERRLVSTLRAARAGGADLLAMPELQLSGYAVGRAASESASTVDELSDVLAGSGLAALVGFLERAGEAFHNSAGYFEDGSPVHVHRKLYLCGYAPFDEHERFAAGDSLRAFDTEVGRVAVLVCNDAWQPFLPSLAAHDGAEILLIPSASSTVMPGIREYWRGLTSFYARMLQCYVVFANRVGREPGFVFWGGSHVVDPWGEIIAEAPLDDEALLFAEIDVKHVAARRRELPLVGDLRPELLRRELDRLASRLHA